MWYIILALWFAGVAQLVEQLICNQQVGGSSPSTSSTIFIVGLKPKSAKLNMGVFPSGQRGQTVNLLSSTSVVRIHPLPPKQKAPPVGGAFCFGKKVVVSRNAPHFHAVKMQVVANFFGFAAGEMAVV